MLENEFRNFFSPFNFMFMYILAFYFKIIVGFLKIARVVMEVTHTLNTTFANVNVMSSERTVTKPGNY